MQPQLITSPEAAKQAGYQAGQAIEQKNLDRRDLLVRANQRFDSDGVPLTLFSYYKDGLIDGYRQKMQS